MNVIDLPAIKRERMLLEKLHMFFRIWYIAKIFKSKRKIILQTLLQTINFRQSIFRKATNIHVCKGLEQNDIDKGGGG